MVIDWMYGDAAAVRLVDGPVQHRRRQPRGHPAQHRRRSRTASACWARRAAAGGTTRPAEGGTQLARRTRTARSTRTCGRTGRACGTSSPRMDADRGAQHGVGGLPDLRRARRRTVLRGAYPWPLTPSVGDNPNDQPDVDTPLASSASSTRRRAATSSRRPSTTCRASARPQRLRHGRASGSPIHGIKVEPQVGGVLVRAQAAAARPDRADPRRERGAADDRDGPAPLLVPGGPTRPVGGTVPATLSLTLGTPASFGAFTPGVGQGLHGVARPRTSSPPPVTRR